MPNSNKPLPSRQWQRLGSTLLDLSPVVKIEFERSDARLFVVSGEALLMTAWTESRTEIAALRQHASVAGGWLMVEAEAAEAADSDYADGDGRGYDADGASSAAGAADQADEARPAAPSSSDHRVRSSAVDRIVSVPINPGPVVDVFASGVFLGRIAGADAVADLETRVGA